MQAQSAAGNDAEALRTYERCRRLLAEELGAYPSAETESIYRRLLDAPPAAATSVEEARTLAASPAGSGALTPARRSRRIVAPAAASALLVAAGILVVGLTGGSATPSPTPNSVVALDPSGSILATVPVGARPTAITSGAGALWIANLDDQTVTRVDTSSRRVVRHIRSRRHANGARRDDRPQSGWSTTAAMSRGRPEVRPASGYTPARATDRLLRGTVRRALAAFGSDLDRESRRSRPAPEPFLRGRRGHGRCRKPPVRHRRWRWIPVGHERQRRHADAHRPADAGHEDDPRR